MFFEDDEADRDFEEGFEQAREHARDVKEAIRNVWSGVFPPETMRLLPELVREGYVVIDDKDGDILVTDDGGDYANTPGLPSLARMMHELGG